MDSILSQKNYKPLLSYASICFLVAIEDLFVLFQETEMWQLGKSQSRLATEELLS